MDRKEKEKLQTRKARTRPPERCFGGRKLGSPFLLFVRRPRTLRRIFAGVCWLGGWAFAAWALSDFLGAAGWKLAAGALLVSSGGLRPLVRILRSGLIAYPPWDWFSETE